MPSSHTSEHEPDIEDLELPKLHIEESAEDMELPDTCLELPSSHTSKHEPDIEDLELPATSSELPKLHIEQSAEYMELPDTELPSSHTSEPDSELALPAKMELPDLCLELPPARTQELPAIVDSKSDKRKEKKRQRKLGKKDRRPNYGIADKSLEVPANASMESPDNCWKLPANVELPDISLELPCEQPTWIWTAPSTGVPKTIPQIQNMEQSGNA